MCRGILPLTVLYLSRRSIIAGGNGARQLATFLLGKITNPIFLFGYIALGELKENYKPTNMESLGTSTRKNHLQV
jgi:hypothetical protein